MEAGTLAAGACAAGVYNVETCRFAVYLRPDPCGLNTTPAYTLLRHIVSSSASPSYYQCEFQLAASACAAGVYNVETCRWAAYLRPDPSHVTRKQCKFQFAASACAAGVDNVDLVVALLPPCESRSIPSDILAVRVSVCSQRVRGWNSQCWHLLLCCLSSKPIAPTGFSQKCRRICTMAFPSCSVELPIAPTGFSQKGRRLCTMTFLSRSVGPLDSQRKSSFSVAWRVFARLGHRVSFHRCCAVSTRSLAPAHTAQQGNADYCYHHYDLRYQS